MNIDQLLWNRIMCRLVDFTANSIFKQEYHFWKVLILDMENPVLIFLLETEGFSVSLILILLEDEE